MDDWLEATNGGDSEYFWGNCSETIDNTIALRWKGYDKYILYNSMWYEILTYSKTYDWGENNIYFGCDEPGRLYVKTRDYECSDTTPCVSYEILLEKVEVKTCLEAAIWMVETKWDSCETYTTAYDSLLWDSDASEITHNGKRLFLRDGWNPYFPSDPCWDKVEFNCFQEGRVVSLRKVTNGGGVRVWSS